MVTNYLVVYFACSVIPIKHAVTMTGIAVLFPQPSVVKTKVTAVRMDISAMISHLSADGRFVVTELAMFSNGAWHAYHYHIPYKVSNQNLVSRTTSVFA